MGKTMMEGESNSMTAIYTSIPTFAPKPLAWGKLKDTPPDTYFFLMEFLDLSSELPDPVDFCSRLAELHQTSKSPTGKFGFFSITCHGPSWQKIEWHESWCHYFTMLLDQFSRDGAPQHERGGYVGIAHIGFKSAPSLGPVLCGVLAQTVGWRWIFRSLVILSGLTLIVFLCFLPETGRKIVGNGSIPASGTNLSLLELLRRRRRTPDARHKTSSPRPKVRVPNPFKSLRMIFHKTTALVLYSNAIFYMKYSCVQASLSPLLMKIYGLTTLQVGLTYLAFGVASALASYGAGRITDYDYRKTATAHGFTINKVSGDKVVDFPIEQARLRSVWYYIAMSSTSTLGYGWALQTRAHLSVPLIMQFLIGLAVTGIFNVCNTLIVDLHPDAPATASASVSLTRCLTAAVGLSVQQLLFDSIGVGWTFTLIAGLCYMTVPSLAVVRWRGWSWRRDKRAREAASEEGHAMADCGRSKTELPRC